MSSSNSVALVITGSLIFWSSGVHLHEDVTVVELNLSPHFVKKKITPVYVNIDYPRKNC